MHKLRPALSLRADSSRGGGRGDRSGSRLRPVRVRRRLRAGRYRANRAMPLDDLRQTARLGLVKAVDRYEPDRVNPFVPYAVATVVGEIKRYLRDASWRLRVPRGIKDLALRLCRAVDELPQELGRSPTVAELAAYLEATEEEV